MVMINNCNENDTDSVNNNNYDNDNDNGNGNGKGNGNGNNNDNDNNNNNNHDDDDEDGDHGPVAQSFVSSMEFNFLFWTMDMIFFSPANLWPAPDTDYYVLPILYHQWNHTTTLLFYVICTMYYMFALILYSSLPVSHCN